MASEKNFKFYFEPKENMTAAELLARVFSYKSRCKSPNGQEAHEWPPGKTFRNKKDIENPSNTFVVTQRVMIGVVE